MSKPLVSVITPVYNGARYLAQCIDSVLAQASSGWEYVIVNNASTDGTRSIAEEYARRDSRIRVIDTRRFLPLIKSWNYALTQLDSESRYSKVLHADDLLFPKCLARHVIRHGELRALRHHRRCLEAAGVPSSQLRFTLTSFGEGVARARNPAGIARRLGRRVRGRAT